MSYQDEYQQSIEQREAFWREQARALPWYRFPQTILSEDDNGIARWFVDGELAGCILGAGYWAGGTQKIHNLTLAILLFRPFAVT